MLIHVNDLGTWCTEEANWLLDRQVVCLLGVTECTTHPHAPYDVWAKLAGMVDPGEYWETRHYHELNTLFIKMFGDK